MKLSIFFNKSINRIKISQKTYKYNKKHFGRDIAKAVRAAEYVAILPIKNKTKYFDYKDKLVYDYLKERYSNLIDRYSNKNNVIEKSSKKYIWVFWYHGLESAPELVKRCIESIKDHSFDYEVVILNKDNISKYIDIPQIILDKVNEKKITLTHFSDILRMGLLSIYGGIWVDATCFITSDVFKKFDNQIFNSNSIDEKQKWCGFFIGGKPNKVFKFCYDMLIDYNEKEDSLIDYFLIEFTLKICNNEVTGANKIIDCSNIKNDKIHELVKKFNNIYQKTEYEKLIKSSEFFKLTYKVNFEENKKNKITNYGYFIERGM